MRPRINRAVLLARSEESSVQLDAKRAAMSGRPYVQVFDKKVYLSKAEAIRAQRDGKFEILFD